MSIDEKKFQALRRRADEARQTRDKSAGQLEGVMARLREEFGVDSVEGAKKLMGRLERKAARSLKAYTEAVADFEAKWEDGDE